MPWFPDSVSDPEPSESVAAVWLPCTMDDAHVSISVGAAIREIVDQLVDGHILCEEHRLAAEVLVASFFVPLLAREDRIAAYLNRSHPKVRAIGRRLRAAGIWRGHRLTMDCYDMLMEEESGNLNMALLAMVGLGKIYGWRGADGEFVFSAERPQSQVRYDAEPCEKCSTTARYTESGTCIECQRRYMRGYFHNAKTED